MLHFANKISCKKQHVACDEAGEGCSSEQTEKLAATAADTKRTPSKTIENYELMNGGRECQNSLAIEPEGRLYVATRLCLNRLPVLPLLIWLRKPSGK